MLYIYHRTRIPTTALARHGSPAPHFYSYAGTHSGDAHDCAITPLLALHHVHVPRRTIWGHPANYARWELEGGGCDGVGIPLCPPKLSKDELRGLRDGIVHSQIRQAVDQRNRVKSRFTIYDGLSDADTDSYSGDEPSSKRAAILYIYTLAIIMPRASAFFSTMQATAAVLRLREQTSQYPTLYLGHILEPCYRALVNVGTNSVDRLVEALLPMESDPSLGLVSQSPDRLWEQNRNLRTLADLTTYVLNPLG